MKRSVLIQIKHLPENAQREQLPAERFVFQFFSGTGVDRREQLNAAAARLTDRRKILRLCDLIDREPLRIHAAQQHEHPLALRAAGEHVRTRPKVKLRHTMHRSGQLQPLIHDSHTLPRLRKRADAAAQQRRFPAAGHTGKQTGLLQIWKQLLRRMTDIMRDTKRKRRDLPQTGHAAVLHDRTAADAEPVPPRQTEIAASQLLLHGILRLRRGIQKDLLKLGLCQNTSDRQKPLSTQIQNGWLLPHPQPKLLDLQVRYTKKCRLYRLRKYAQDLISHFLTPTVQVYCLSAPGIPPS